MRTKGIYGTIIGNMKVRFLAGPRRQYFDGPDTFVITFNDHETREKACGYGAFENCQSWEKQQKCVVKVINPDLQLAALLMAMTKLP